MLKKIVITNFILEMALLYARLVYNNGCLMGYVAKKRK